MKEETRAELMKDIGKILVDLAKSVFTAFLLGGIIRGNIPANIIAVIGFFGFTVLAVIGLKFIHLIGRKQR
jgi:hypothetical protein